MTKKGVKGSRAMDEYIEKGAARKIAKMRDGKIKDGKEGGMSVGRGNRD